MSWAGIANNQCVSLNNLKDAVANMIFLQLNTIPTGTKQITKSEASYYVNCATYYPPFANKASNQLVVKSDLVGRVVIPVSLSWDSSNAGTLQIYTASPSTGSYTLQTTLTAPGGAAGTTSTTISLINGDGIYVVLTHTARTSAGQRGQIFQVLNGSTTTYQTTSGTLPKSVTSGTWVLSHLNTYSISSNLGNPV
jgi:hypothetical protein